MSLGNPSVSPYTAQQPVTDFSLPFASAIYNCVMPANTVVSLVVPSISGRLKAVINYTYNGGNLWVAYNSIPTIPSSSTFVLDNQEVLNGFEKICRDVVAGNTLNFISDFGGITVNVAFYSFSLT